MNSLVEWLDEIPPVVLRLAAGRKDRTLLSHEEFARVSGLGLRKVRDMSDAESFADFTARDIDMFMLGCGVRLHQRYKVKEFIKRNLQRVAEGKGGFSGIDPWKRNFYLGKLGKK